MVRPGSQILNLENIEGLDIFRCDLQDKNRLKEAFAGRDLVFHVAGVFAYWGYEPQALIEEASQGMRNVMEAAKEAGVRRLVITSSSVTLGMSRKPEVLDEDSIGSFEQAPAYIRAKLAQENLAMDLARQSGLEAVAVLPTLTLGSQDAGLSESNRMIVSYLNDPWRSTWIGGCNIVSVADICQAHLLVAQYGQSGMRYLAGGENLSWKVFHTLVSELCGVPGPYLTAYHTSAYLAATFYELSSYFSGEPPLSSREQARMVGNYYWYNDQRLRALGYQPGSARQALIETISWVVKSKHISPSLRSTLELAPDIHTFRKAAQV
jgi:dihydroflavonol-4-reductase